MKPKYTTVTQQYVIAEPSLQELLAIPVDETITEIDVVRLGYKLGDEKVMQNLVIKTTKNIIPPREL